MCIMVSSSHFVSLTAPTGSASYRIQFSVKFTNVSASHRQQSSSNCCSVGHSPMECNPAKTGCSSMGPFSMGLPWLHILLSGIQLLWHGACPWAVGGSLHPCGSLWAAPWTAPLDTRNLLPLLLHLPWCLRSCSSHMFSLLFSGHNYKCTVT